MSNLTERIDAYTMANTDPPETVAAVIMGTIRTISECLGDLSKAIECLNTLDTLRASRIADLQRQFDRLEERIDF